MKEIKDKYSKAEALTTLERTEFESRLAQLE